jgi:hypothetical protein
MAQSDQVVQNATFPSVRADINDNLAALYSQNSGNSAPTVTVAFQTWVDTSVNPPLWKVRNGSNTAWITVGVLDPAGFNAGGITAIANGGTGATTATTALAALLPSQAGNAGKALITSGSLASWGVVAAGASLQTFTSSGTYTPTSGKTTFLVFATGGGCGGSTQIGGLSGGGGGTAVRVYTSVELGVNASITVGGAGGTGNPPSSGGNTSFTPTGTGLQVIGYGGALNTGGSTLNSQFNINGQSTGSSFWAGGNGCGGRGATLSGSATGGVQGGVFILEW